MILSESFALRPLMALVDCLAALALIQARNSWAVPLYPCGNDGATAHDFEVAMTCFRAPDLEVAMTFFLQLAALAPVFEVALTLFLQLAALAPVLAVALTLFPQLAAMAHESGLNFSNDLLDPCSA